MQPVCYIPEKRIQQSVHGRLSYGLWPDPVIEKVL